jgi:FPC/CPF motif-containing protein YcgG
MSYYLSRKTHAGPAANLRRQFEAFIRQQEFPCVGAKSALKRGQMKVIVARDVQSAWDDLRLHEEIRRFAEEYERRPKLFSSVVIIFRRVRNLSEEAFESALWDRLQSLHDKDSWLGYDYDQRVESDPDSPHFAFSLGGSGFFVVGLHPGASRKARRFAHPAIVFNLHDQFERLRASGRYQTLRSKILQRDKAYSGSINPMLVTHGEGSAAPQYSGRKVGQAWRCPFHPHSAETSDKPENRDAA